MKNLLVFGLVVALVLDVGVFVGVGVATPGSGLAVTATPPSLVNSCSGPGGILFCVNFSTPSDTDGAFVSNWRYGNSTPLTFSVTTIIGSNKDGQPNAFCGNSEPGWDVGAGQDYGYLKIQVLSSGSGSDSPVVLQNQSTLSFSTATGALVTMTSTAFYVSFNSTPTVNAYCYGPGEVSSSPYVPWLPTTFTLVGQFSDYDILEVQFLTKGHFCGSSLTVISAACNLASGEGPGASTGTWTADAIGDSYLRNGGGFITLNHETVYNGETFTVTGTTYYDAGQGFQLIFSYPNVRNGTAITKVKIPDDTNYSASITVPANAATNYTGSNGTARIEWNQFSLALYGPVAEYTYADLPVDISPAYAPPAPVISYVDTAGGTVVHTGDRIQVSIIANGTTSPPQHIISIVLWVWFLTPAASNNGGGLPPPNSPAWVTPGGQGGDALSVVTFDNAATASYAFVVTQPYSFIIQAESITNLSETSVAQASETVYVQPPGCTTPMCALHEGSEVWAVLAPATISIALLLTSVLVAVVVKQPYVRVLVPVVAVAAVVSLYLFGVFAAYFNPGAPFNTG